MAGAPVVAETERLLLRPWREDDFPTLKALLTDAETMRHWPAPLNEAAVRSWLANGVAQWRDRKLGRWAVVRKSDGAVIGDCGLMAGEVGGSRVTDLGYVIHADFQGKGYGVEAARAALRHGRDALGLTDIICHMAEDHTASRRVAERLGLVEVRRFANARNEGKVHVVYALPGLPRPTK